MILKTCPVCKNDLKISHLSCSKCGLEIKKDFTPGPFDHLEKKETEFIQNFLLVNGNLKKLSELTQKNYHQTKLELERIKERLSLRSTDRSIQPSDISLTTMAVYPNESPIVKAIKEKLNRSNGLARIPLPRGSYFQIYYEEYGTGIHATNIPSNKVLTWQAFEDAITLLNKKGGKAIKGNAMKGKLGDNYLPLDSVEGYVAYHTFHVKKGETTLRFISALSAILEWTGFCRNGYGYLELK